MKFGVFFTVRWHEEWTQERSLLDVLERAELADQAGFDEIWLGEHHFSRHGILSGLFSFTGHVAARTKKSANRPRRGGAALPQSDTGGRGACHDRHPERRPTRRRRGQRLPAAGVRGPGRQRRGEPGPVPGGGGRHRQGVDGGQADLSTAGSPASRTLPCCPSRSRNRTRPSTSRSAPAPPPSTTRLVSRSRSSSAGRPPRWASRRRSSPSGGKRWRSTATPTLTSTRP